MITKKTFLILLLLIFGSISFAQKSLHDFGFNRNQNIPVADSVSNAYLKAWAGGLNYCQFMQIDLNMDGIKDLVIFDRTSTRIIPFINNNISDSSSYTYAPQYAKRFPEIKDWVQLADYNCDGKEDLFTYYAAGLRVYKNVSNTTDSLKFSLVTNQLLSLQGVMYTNIAVSQVAYPAIADIDGDGDLDILNFFSLGSYVEYQKNLSMEDYGNCDSLKFVREERCWGNFMQSFGNNSITLGIGPCLWKNETISNQIIDQSEDKSEIKHLGSTMLAIDLDSDGDKDLIVGDVAYPSLVALYNTGTADSANITSIDTLFPVYDQPVHLFAFPLACYQDINNDGVKEMMVSPFDSSPTSSENFHSVWLYQNNGTNSSPVFHLTKKNFLQEDMIDVGAGAYPVLYDYDGDSLLDLFVANYAYYDSSYISTDSLTLGTLYNFCTSRITLFKNIGTASNPQFQLITRDFANLGSKKLKAIYPAFGDLDGDGDADMIIGDYLGNLYRYENTAGPGNPMVMTYNDSLHIDVGFYSTPQLIDLDRDSLLELVVGEKNGNLNYYDNTGTQYNPVFTLVTDSLGHIDVIDHSWSNYGYSVPCFFEDSIGRYKLFVGSESGNIFYYKNIEDSINGHFTLYDPKLLEIYEGTRSGVAVGNLNNDGYLDMIIGNFSGGLSYFDGSVPQTSHVGVAESTPVNPFDIKLFPNPAENSITISLSEINSGNPISIRIYDLLGNTVFSKELKGNDPLSVNVMNFSNGVYICNVSSMAKDQRSWYSVSRKFIVQH